MSLSQCVNSRWQNDVVGHSRPRWSRPRLVHVRFNPDSDRQPSKRDPALRAKKRLMHCNMIGEAKAETAWAKHGPYLSDR